MRMVDNSIEELLKLQTQEESKKYATFLQRSERAEDDFRHHLQERRAKKLSQLSRNTYGPQNTTPGEKSARPVPGIS